MCLQTALHSAEVKDSLTRRLTAVEGELWELEGCLPDSSGGPELALARWDYVTQVVQYILWNNEVRGAVIVQQPI